MLAAARVAARNSRHSVAQVVHQVRLRLVFRLHNADDPVCEVPGSSMLTL